MVAGKIADGAVTPDKLSTRYLPAGTAGVPVAGASVAGSGSLRAWFNGSGGEPTVQRISTGNYKLVFLPES